MEFNAASRVLRTVHRQLSRRARIFIKLFYFGVICVEENRTVLRYGVKLTAK